MRRGRIQILNLLVFCTIKIASHRRHTNFDSFVASNWGTLAPPRRCETAIVKTVLEQEQG